MRLIDDSSNPGGVGSTPRRLRVALYSHDGEGLGHVKRNLLIARALLEQQPGSSALLISGLKEAATYAMPRGVDCLTLPSIGKTGTGEYCSRSIRMETDELVRMRAATIAAAVSSFQPDLFIVDKLPTGVLGELLPCLRRMRQTMHTRVVLGLREILDTPEAVARDWKTGDCVRAIDQFFDDVWVYGDEAIYDTALEYDFPMSVRSKLSYLGYLNPRDVASNSAWRDERMALPSGSLSLCVVGGGRDGLPIAEAFLRAKVPHGSGRVLLTGPLLGRQGQSHLQSLAGRRSDTCLIQSVTDALPLLCCADRVIAMGGYNTICEILAFQKRALIIPRVRPRREQIIRAERLVSHGMIDMLHPDLLSDGAMSEWLCTEPRGVPAASDALDFHGIRRLKERFDSLASVDGTGRRAVVNVVG